MTEQPLSNPEQINLVEVKNLIKYFPVRAGLLQRTVAQVKAVDDVSFNVRQGETLGLVGESGCGKTIVGRTILRLIEPTSGEVTFEGKDILKLKGNELKDMRRNMQIIFQDPYASLDPRMPIGESVIEGLKIHNIGTAKERQAISIETLRKVGLEDYHSRRYPHEFSGGQRQRIGIARALTLRPKFIIADEPVSALDVSIQSQVLNILKDLQREFELTYLFIAHNLSVVEHISDRVAVMYRWRVLRAQHARGHRPGRHVHRRRDSRLDEERRSRAGAENRHRQRHQHRHRERPRGGLTGEGRANHRADDDDHRLRDGGARLRARHAARRRQHGGSRQLSGRLWAAAFVMTAVAAFVGGTYHGFIQWMPGLAGRAMWKATLLATGLGSACLLAAAVVAAVAGPLRTALAGVVIAKLTFYIWTILRG